MQLPENVFVFSECLLIFAEKLHELDASEGPSKSLRKQRQQTILVQRVSDQLLLSLLVSKLLAHASISERDRETDEREALASESQ